MLVGAQRGVEAQILPKRIYRHYLLPAEPLYRRALAIWETQLGPDHPDVARCLSNLADFYHERGRLSAAESLYTRALATLEKALGQNHPQVAVVGQNLADVYRAHGSSWWRVAQRLKLGKSDDTARRWHDAAVICIAYAFAARIAEMD